MEYYTVEEAASFLAKTPEWLLEQMVAPDLDSDSFITPSAYFEKPLLVISRTGEEELLGGWFELHGMNEVNHQFRAFNIDEMCYPSIEEGRSRYGELYQDGKPYRPKYRLKVSRTDFRISQKELEYFAELTGRRIRPPATPNSLGESATPDIGSTTRTDFFKTLVQRAFWEKKEELNRFPKYTEVIKQLRHITKIDEMAGAIIKEIDHKGNVTLVDGAMRTVKTIMNWLIPLRKS